MVLRERALGPRGPQTTLVVRREQKVVLDEK
jgi:hypothetical protein